MNGSAPVELSVVVPVYGCAACLDALLRRIGATLDARGISHEVVFVDDASRDNAADVLAQLSAREPRVVVVSEPENRGQHAAIADGLAHATGQWAAVMDCDLQDPPELLPAMLASAREGADIVVGKRGIHAQPLWRRVATRAFMAAARRRHSSALIGTHSLYSVLSRRAVEGYLRHPARTAMYLPVLEALNLPTVSIDYDRLPRMTGHSAYGATGLFRRAWRVLTMPAVVARDRATPSARASRQRSGRTTP